MKSKLIVTGMLAVLMLVLGNFALAQCPADTGDVDDTGTRDSLLINQVPGRLNANTQWTTVVRGFHDEALSGFSIEIKYKNPQTDVFVDSIKFHPDIAGKDISDTIVVRDTGLITVFAIWFDSLSAGTHTFFSVYFRTGATWDPATPNPLDTFRLGSGQGLSYTTTLAADITPWYCPPGNLDVRRDPFNATGIPKSFSLSQNFPNPFNAETVISFGLPKTSHVKLEIYNILGQKVKDLVDEKVTAGYKRVVWDGKDNNGNTVSSGVYFYKLDTEEFTEVMKMTILK